MDEFENLNKQIVDGIALGSMEGKTQWLSGEILGLQKRIEYHERIIAQATEYDVKAELMDRLASFQRRLKSFKISETNQNYITTMDILYSFGNAPEVFFHNSHRTYGKRILPDAYVLKIKFWINFSGRNKVKWAVEDVIPRSESRGSFKGAHYTYECKDFNKIPSILLTLPSLITEETLLDNLNSIKPYIYDLRNPHF